MNLAEQLGTLRSSSLSQQLELAIGEKKRVKGIFDHGSHDAGTNWKVFFPTMRLLAN